MKQLSSGEKGQSLIGILIVAAIGAFLAWYMLGGGNGTTGGNSNPQESIQESEEAQTQQDISLLQQAIRRYRAENGSYPPDLRTLINEDYVSAGAVKAPNGTRYDYNPQTGSVSK